MSEGALIEILKIAGPITSTVISGYLAVKLAKIHRQFNSRMDELVESKIAQSRMKGQNEGRKEEVVRVENLKSKNDE